MPTDPRGVSPRTEGSVMRKTHEKLLMLGVAVLLLIPLAASAADQTVEVQVLAAGTLSIDVESDFGLGWVVPETSTDLRDFWMGITNTTTSGWQVNVTGTDLQSFDWDCDEQDNCTRVVHTSPSVIDASAIHVRGGDQDHWPASPDAIIAYEGNLTGAGVPFILMDGTATAYGSFGFDEGQRAAVRVDVPAGAAEANYFTTLTYTITGS